MQQGPDATARDEATGGTASPSPSRWTLPTIRATFDWLADYSLSGVWRFLRGSGLKLRSADVQQHSPDALYRAKLVTLLACLRLAVEQPEAVVVLFLDEMGYYRWPDPAPTWTAAAPTARPRAERAGPNNRQQRLIGALNAVTGQVDYLDNYIIGREKVIAFYERLNGLYPHAKRIYVVQDNWSIHRHAEVEVALGQWKRIERVWLPTYAPWLNPIEKLWRKLRTEGLAMHRLADDWLRLRAHVNAFLDQFKAGSQVLLRYVGLAGDGLLAQALRPT